MGLTHNFILNLTTCLCKFSQSIKWSGFCLQRINYGGHSQNTWRCFYPFLPLPTTLWQCVTASCTPHHNIRNSEPTTPPQKKILTKHKFNMQQQIQNVIKKSTLFILNLSLNSFPLRFSLVCWLNGSAVFHGNVRRSILIENINLSSTGHIFASTILFCYI